VPFTGVELPRRREIDRPLRILRPFHRPLVFLGRCDLEGVLQDPLLYRQELFPPEPLRVHPASEVLALHDDVARSRGERPAGLDVVVDEAVAPLPPGVPYRAPPRIDRVQLILCRALVIAPAAEGTGRPAARSSSFSRALRAAARAFFAHTPMGCPSQVAVVGGRKCPWAAAYSLATAIPSAQAASCSDHTIPSRSSSATRPASSVPAV